MATQISDFIGDSNQGLTVQSTIDPTMLDDGLKIGTIWVNIDTNKSFTCVDNTSSNAVWDSYSGDSSFQTIISNAVDQNQTVTINHAEDTNGRTVDVSKLVNGLSNQIRDDIDYVLSEESDYIQENSIEGTSFNGTDVSLKSNGIPSPATLDPNGHSSYISLSNGNLTATQSHNGWDTFAETATITGDSIYYWENTVTSGNRQVRFGAYIEGSMNPVNSGTAVGGNNQSISYYVGKTHDASGDRVTGLSYPDIGDVVGQALQPSTGKWWVSLNGVWEKGYAPADGAIAVDTFTSGEWRIANSLYWSGTENTFTFNSNDWAYTPDNVIAIETMVYSYQTTTGYFVSTSDTNKLYLNTITNIDSLVISQNEPENTTIKWLVSFDGRATWNTVSGTTWTQHLSGLNDFTGANTASEIEAGFVNFFPTTEETIDIAFELSTTDSNNSPSVDKLTFTVDENGKYHKIQVGSDITIIEDTLTSIKATKLSVGTETLKFIIGT